MNNFDFHNIDFSNPVVLVGGVAVILLIAGAIALAMHQRKKKSEALRARFGSEYDFVLKENGARSKAEAKLMDRVHRVERFKLRDLTPTERERFTALWSAVQSRFVDHPRGAVTDADDLINNVMLARGFPVATLDQRVEDITVHHARLADSYRSANTIALRAGRNEATTEELRTAMIHYRGVFDELLQAGPAVVSEPVPPETPLLRRSA